MWANAEPRGEKETGPCRHGRVRSVIHVGISVGELVGRDRCHRGIRIEIHLHVLRIPVVDLVVVLPGIHQGEDHHEHDQKDRGDEDRME